MSATAANESLIERLIHARLVTAEQVESARAAVPSGDERAVAEELVRRRLLTSWQVGQAERGHRSFFLEHGRYLLLEQIGQGGMGSVFRARHVRLNRDVALKVIDPKKVSDPNLVQRFRREVEVSARLQHEHIVQALDVGEHGRAAFLVLEFVEGSDLASLVKRDGAINPGEAAAITLQAAAGLAYAHAQGIVHRDIKPQNILLSTKGVTKILDMGLARIVEEATDLARTGLTQDGAVMGMVDYMAPEQARDSHAVDGRCDIYSLGATLYFLLTGRPPFAGGNTIEKLHRLATQEPPPVGQLRPDCPRELSTVVERMMAKHPADRFPSAEDVVRALSPLASERISGRPVATAAVRMAAETQRNVGVDTDVPEMTFSVTQESVLRKRHREQRLPRWLWAVAAVAAAVVTVLAVSGRPASPPSRSISPADKASAAAVPEPLPPAGFRRELPGHSAGIWSIAFSPLTREVATGGGDGLVLIRDPYSGLVLRRYEEHAAPVIRMDWSDDGRLIASEDLGGEIRIWNAGTGELRARIEAPREGVVSQSRLGRLAFSAAGEELAYAHQRKVMRYDVRAQSIVWSDDFLATFRLAYSPSGRLLAATAIDGAVRVWDLESGARLVDEAADQQAKVPGFLRDETLVLARQGAVQLRDCRSGEVIREYEIPACLTDAAGPHQLPRMEISRDGRCFVLSEGRATIVDLHSGEQTPMSLPAEPEPHSHGALAWRIAPNFSRWGYAPAEYFGGVPFVFANLPSRRAETPFRDYLLGQVIHHNGVHGFETSRGRILTFHRWAWDLATGEVWEAESPELIARQEIASVALERDQDFAKWKVWTDDRRLVWAPPAVGKSTMAFWNASDGRLVRTIDLGAVVAGRDFDSYRWSSHWPSVSSSRGDVVAYPFDDGRIDVWREAGGKPTLSIPTGLSNGTLSIVISPDGNLIAATHQNRSVTLWDARDGRRIAALRTDLPPHHGIHLSFSPSSRQLAVTRQIWDAAAPAPTKLWECPESSRGMSSGANGETGGGILRFCTDDRVVILQNAELQVWDWRANKKELTLYPLPDDNWAMVNHTNGRWKASPLGNQYLRLLHRDGDAQEWLSPREYEEQTGWKNEPGQVGLAELLPP